MPQFNWSVVGPALLALALLLGGGGLLATHVPHPGAPAGRSTAAAAEAATRRAQGGSAAAHVGGLVIGTPHLRNNPNSNAIVLQDLQSGETVDVSGCAEACIWYLVTPPDRSAAGWVPSAFIHVQGDEQKLPGSH